MNFPLQVEKTIQVVGVLFRTDRVMQMSYMRLLKLLYIADRESIKETGRPIVGGQVVAMEHGTVLEEVYDLIRGRHSQMPLWDKFFQKDRYLLSMRTEPDVRKLSKYEIDKLQSVAKKHECDDEWVLSRLTHDFEEWQKNDPGTSSRKIPLADILNAVGLSASTNDIIEDAKHLWSMRTAFARQFWRVRLIRHVYHLKKQRY